MAENPATKALQDLGVPGFTPQFFTPKKGQKPKEQNPFVKGVTTIVKQLGEAPSFNPPSVEENKLSFPSDAARGKETLESIGSFFRPVPTTAEIQQERKQTLLPEEVKRTKTKLAREVGAVPITTDAMQFQRDEELYVPVDLTLAGFVKKVGGKVATTGAKSVLEKIKGLFGKGDITKPPIPPTTKMATVPRSGGKKTVPQVFREDKLDLTPIEQKAVVDRLSVLGLETRGVRTFEEMEEAAQVLGTDVERLLKEVRQSRITDSEVVALRNLISGNVDAITSMEKRIIGDATQGTLLQPQIDLLQSEVDTALKKIVRGGTEAGRAVASFRILANKTLDPAIWMQKAQRVLGERELTSEMRNHILNLVENKDRVGLANYVSMLRTPSLAEKGATLWKAGLLTSPTTHLANMGGNTTMAVLETASNVVSTSFDVLGSLVTGNRTIVSNPATIFAKIKGAKQGISEATSFAKTGIYSVELMTKYDLPKQVTFENKFLDGYTKAIFRSLGAEDIFFRRMAMNESLESSARVIAKNEGLRGGLYSERVKSLLLEPPNEMVFDAIGAAEYATFQNKNGMAEVFSAARSKAYTFNPWAGVLFEFIAPFTRTPTNIALRVADYTPIGFVKAIIRAIPANRSQAKIVKDLGRATTGTSLLALGAYLSTRGLMTGNAPTSKSERDQFYAEGKQPNSLRIGDTWYQLNRISPSGNLLALGAEFNQKGRELEGATLALSTFGAGVKGLFGMTFLKGISSTLDLLNDPELNAERYLQGLAASFVPAVIGRTTHAIDPTSRVPDGILQAVEARLPFLAENVAERRDVFGNKVEARGGRLRLVDPFDRTKAVDNPILQEARRLGVFIGLPNQTISNTKLTNAEYSLYQKIQGKLLEQHLKAMTESEGYRILTDVEKEKRFQRAITDFRTELNDLVFPALMIKRYGLSNETNPVVFRLLLNELGKDGAFKKKTVEQQGVILRKLLAQQSEG